MVFGGEVEDIASGKEGIEVGNTELNFVLFASCSVVLEHFWVALFKGKRNPFSHHAYAIDSVDMRLHGRQEEVSFVDGDEVFCGWEWRWRFGEGFGDVKALIDGGIWRREKGGGCDDGFSL